jgi:hypothetical protein
VKETKLTKADDDPGRMLHQLINGYRISQTIHVAAWLRIADQLADGPRSSDDLAVTTGTNPSALYRLLRALAAAHIFRESEGRRFSLTPMALYLQAAVPGSRQAWATFIGRPVAWEAWGQLLHSVRTGDTAIHHAHGTDVWGYRASHPEEGAIFDLAMGEGSLRAADTILAIYDFAQFQKVVDVGGADATFLSRVLMAHPHLSGVLFDRPHVVAKAPQVLEAAGVASRCEVTSGSFFDRVPSGADAYILKLVLHDWADEPAVAILRRCRQAMTKSGRLLVIERVLGPPNEVLEGKLSDLNMLISAGGQERTEHEFAALLELAGFEVRSVLPTTGELALLEAAPGTRRNVESTAWPQP